MLKIQDGVFNRMLLNSIIRIAAIFEVYTQARFLSFKLNVFYTEFFTELKNDVSE